MAITVDDLYSLVLNREADPGGRDFWTNYIKQGPTRGIDPQEIEAFIAGGVSGGENVAAQNVSEFMGLLANRGGSGGNNTGGGTTKQARYTNFETVKAPTADVDQAQEPDKYFATDTQTGKRVELFKASDYPVGTGPAGTSWLVATPSEVISRDGKRYLPFEAVDANGNPLGTWNMEKNELSNFAKVVGGATKIAALAASGYAIGSSLGIFDGSYIGADSFFSDPSKLFVPGADSAGAEFIASDAAQLASQKMSTAQIQQILAQAGVDPIAAASAANLASTGATVAEIAADLAKLGASDLFTGTLADATLYSGITATTKQAVSQELLNQLKGGAKSLFESGVSGVSDYAGTLAKLTAAGPLLSALTSGALTENEINTLKSLGAQAQKDYSQLGKDVSRDVSFTPYGVSTGLFTTSRPAGGDLNRQYDTKNDATAAEVAQIYQDIFGRAPDPGGLKFYDEKGFSSQQIAEQLRNSPEYTSMPRGTGFVSSSLTADGKGLFDAASTAAQGSFTEAGTADLDKIASDRMKLYESLVSPEQQRSRLAQEARLLSQGRLGIGAGGGEYAPELKALEDAIAKQNLQFALAAPQEALAQRAGLIQQGVAAAQVPTTITGQQIQALQLGGQLGQMQATTAAQRGGLLGQYTGQGISENLLAQIAAAQVASERNKAIGTAIGGLFV
jgi:hypothetical protein